MLRCNANATLGHPWRSSGGGEGFRPRCGVMWRMAVDDGRAVTLKAHALGAMLMRLMTVVDGQVFAVRAYALASVRCDAWLSVMAKLWQWRLKPRCHANATLGCR